MATAAITSQKRLGAYYTPPSLADYLVNWAIQRPDSRVLDPACGDAAFLTSASRRLKELGGSSDVGQLFGYEIDPEAADDARAAVDAAAITTTDFFQVGAPDQPSLFDAVVGNPPYIRFHHFNGSARDIALDRARAAGVDLSRLSSSWAPFLVHSASFLAEGGRLAFVLPSELLLTDYAEPIRRFLEVRFSRVDVITFEERVFPGAMVDAVLLLAEGVGPGQVHVRRARNVESLRDLSSGNKHAANGSKWSVALLSDSASRAFERVPNEFVPLGEFATVDIGIVTGANDFFLLSQSDVAELGLESSALRPAIGRARQMSPPVLFREDWESQRGTSSPTWLFAPDALSRNAEAYVRQGEAASVHQGYKCRIRTPWWRLRVPAPPDMLLSYMSNRVPQLTANEAGVVTTNLIHNLRLRNPRVPARWLALSWLNSVTLLSSELNGRAYGGGVLKLETREAERVLVPPFDAERYRCLDDNYALLANLLKEGLVERAITLVDDVVLSGISSRDRLSLRDGWMDLQSRRLTRAKPARRVAA